MMMLPVKGLLPHLLFSGAWTVPEEASPEASSPDMSEAEPLAPLLSTRQRPHENNMLPRMAARAIAAEVRPSSGNDSTTHLVPPIAIPSRKSMVQIRIVI